jgi:outer membrane receptor protein involved in Fe transport
LVDGIRLNNSTYRLGNHQYLTTVDNLLAEKIEVVRGPTSVLYGSDALGGTINIISKKPTLSDSKFTTDFKLYSHFASADAEKTARAEASLQNSKFAVQTGFSYKNYGDLKRGKLSPHSQIEKSTNGLIQTPSGYSGYDFDAKLHYASDSSQVLTFAYQLTRQSHIPRYDKYENDNYLRWIYHPQNRNLLYLKYDKYTQSNFLSALHLTLSYHHQNEGREIQESPSSVLTNEQDHVHTYGASIQANGNYKDHAITVGGEFYLDKVYSKRLITSIENGKTINDVRGRYPDDTNYSSLGIYVQDELGLTSRLKLILGARFSYVRVDFDFIDFTGHNSNLVNFIQAYKSITGGFGSIYEIYDNIFIKFNLAQAFRAPNLSDLSKLGESKGNIYEIPNVNLKPENLTNIDFGLDLDYSLLNLHTVVFYSSITNLIASAEASVNSLPHMILDNGSYKFKSKQNIGRAFIRGMEANINLNFYKKLSLFANITATLGQNVTLNEPVGGIPPTFGILGLKWLPSSKYLYFYMRFAAKQVRLSSDDKDDPRIPEGGTPAWKIFNIRTGFKVSHFSTIFLSVENIIDYNYREHGSGINGPGRNFIFGMEFRF